jgi:heavy metal sensor kinase
VTPVPRSFKLKMALFSLATSGAILLVFSALFLSAVRRAGVERVDRHLLTLAEGQLRGPPSERNWTRFDESLAAVYGAEGRRRFFLSVLGPGQTPIHVSSNWPAALIAADLLPPESAVGRHRDAPEFRRPFPWRSAAAPDETDAPPPPPPAARDGQPPRPVRGPPPGNLQEPGPDGRPPLHPRLSPPVFRTVRAEGREWRLVALRGPRAALVLGTDMAELQAELRRIRTVYALALPLGLLLLASGGWLLARQALRPVRLLARVATDITAKGLDRRVPAEDADQEFQALIDVINGMLNRLETSFRQAARFSADAAHELKTPLTILQGQLNQALRNAPSDSAEQRTYAALLDEVQRLKAIIRKLLLLAQSDAGQLRLSREAIDLDRELDALFEDLPLLAPDLTLTRDLEPDVTVSADPDLLRQLLQNLMSNAVKYNRANGGIACTLRRENGRAHLAVANTVAPGVRIDRERLFDRFYRGDAAHSRQVDGTGLGLSLAREISLAHGGDLVAEDVREGWITFHLFLPLEPELSPR